MFRQSLCQWHSPGYVFRQLSLSVRHILVLLPSVMPSLLLKMLKFLLSSTRLSFPLSYVLLQDVLNIEVIYRNKKRETEEKCNERDSFWSYIQKLSRLSVMSKTKLKNHCRRTLSLAEKLLMIWNQMCFIKKDTLHILFVQWISQLFQCFQKLFRRVLRFLCTKSSFWEQSRFNRDKSCAKCELLHLFVFTST